jgi:hypothetical protein
MRSVNVARFAWRLPVQRVLSAALAPLLLLLTPFVVFLQYHRYGPFHAEVMACLAVLAAAAIVLGAISAASTIAEVAVLTALLTLFIDIQFDSPNEKIGFALTALGLFAVVWVLRRHAAQIVALTMATILISTLLLPRAKVTVGHGGSGEPTREDLPLIVHIVFDEHGGIEGLPADITPPEFRRQLTRFYLTKGFRLFGRAYSEHFETQRSLSHALNFEPGVYDRRLVAPGKGGAFDWMLTRNAYFDGLARQGYAIRVLETDFMDFCGNSTARAACTSYRVKSLDALDGLDAPAREKVRVVAGMYLERSYLYSKVREHYIELRRHGAGWLPEWGWERTRVGPVSSMAAFDEVIARMAKARRGEMMFAHLLLPHYPYVYDANCHTRPPSEWLDRTDVEGKSVANNTRESRARRYESYFGQVACVEKKIDEMIAAIPAPLQHDAIIVVHGDHGSRITLADPQPAKPDALSPSDYLDAYSTLFAVRAPQLQVGYDRQLTPITCLMRTLATSHFQSVAELGACSGSPIVFFDAHVTKPMQGFAAISATAPQTGARAAAVQHVAGGL